MKSLARSSDTFDKDCGKWVGGPMRLGDVLEPMRTGNQASIAGSVGHSSRLAEGGIAVASGAGAEENWLRNSGGV